LGKSSAHDLLTRQQRLLKPPGTKVNVVSGDTLTFGRYWGFAKKGFVIFLGKISAHDLLTRQQRLLKPPGTKVNVVSGDTLTFGRYWGFAKKGFVVFALTKFRT
jgi:predicted N-acyltransferase